MANCGAAPDFRWTRRCRRRLAYQTAAGDRTGCANAALSSLPWGALLGCKRFHRTAGVIAAPRPSPVWLPPPAARDDARGLDRRRRRLKPQRALQHDHGVAGKFNACPQVFAINEPAALG